MKRILLISIISFFVISGFANTKQRKLNDNKSYSVETQESVYNKSDNPKATVTLRARVKDGITGSSIAYVGVTINGVGTFMADQYGLATIGGLNQNTQYNYTISTNGIYTTKTGSVYMEMTDKNIIVYLYPPGYTATFRIKNADTNAPVEGANIIIHGTMYNITTNSQGEATALLPNNLNDYTYDIYCNGYITKTNNSFHLYGSNVTVNNTLEPAYLLFLNFYNSGQGTVNLDGTTYSSNQNLMFDWNENLNFTATPNEGYKFDHWEVYRYSNMGPPTFESSSENLNMNLILDFDKQVRAYFSEIVEYAVTFTVTDGSNPLQNANIHIFDTDITTNSNGQATINLEDGNYNYTVSKEGFTTINGSTTVNGAPVNLNVVLSDATSHKTLTISINGNGSAKVNGLNYTGAVTVPEGTQLTITAVPDAHNSFVTWNGDFWSTNAQETITLNNNMNITANFTINTYTLTYIAGTGGNITGTSTQEVEYGSNGTTVTAVPNAGYQFVQWSDGSVTNPRTDVNVTTNISVTAIFEEIPAETYIVSFNVFGSNGSVTASVDGVTISSGSEVEETKTIVFNANPASGYMVKEWTVSGVIQSESGTTLTYENLQSNISISVEFEEIPEGTYMVSFYVTGSNGSITATVDGSEISSGVVVEELKNIVLTATPDANYDVKEWTVNGVVQETKENEFIFNDLQEDVTVEVTFESTLYLGVNNFSDAKLHIYPNPSNGNFTIDLSTDINDAVIHITDIAGRKVNFSMIKSYDKLNINLSDNPNGIYIVVIKSGDKLLHSKIIKK